MTPEMPLSAWIILAVAGGGIAVLGFLVRNAFETTTKAVEALGTEVKSLRGDLSKGDGDRRVLEARVVTLERDYAELRRELRELSEGIAR